MAASSSTFNRAFAAGERVELEGPVEVPQHPVPQPSMAQFGNSTAGWRRLRRPHAVRAMRAARSVRWRCCGGCVAVCLAWQWHIWHVWCVFFAKGLSFAQFVAIPICHGASASLNQLARAELEGAGMSIRATKGRWYLEASDVDRSNLLEDLRDVRHVRSIRRIISCFNCTSVSEDVASLVERLIEGADWDSVLEDLEYLRAISNISQYKPISSFCVVCKKLSKLTALLALEAELRQELAQCLQRRLGWLATGRGRSPDLTVHVHVEGSFILLEIPILQQSQMMVGGTLPFQGMHHVEAWAIARSLNIREGDVVLDPMCGQGTLLAEAAIWWPNATFVGCDVNGSQLERCNANFKALSQVVSLHQVDAAYGGIPLQDGSVEKIMVAPPWNRQFAIRGRPQEFYEKMFRELFRVSDKGRIVLFVSRRVLQRIKDALEAVDSCWSIVEQRSFTVTRKTVGIILSLEAVRKSDGMDGCVRDPTDRLFWERDAPSDGRDLYEYWREVRARGFPRLNPVVT